MKPTKQSIKELREEFDYDFPNDCSEVFTKTLARLEAAESAQQPRPVTDLVAMPEPGTPVYAVAIGSVPLHCGNDCENWVVDKITHWIPLPDQSGGE